MGLGELFEGITLAVECIVNHPIKTIVGLAVGIPLIAGGVYSCNKYDEWKAPSRAQDLYQITLNNEREFRYEESTGFLKSKVRKGHIKGFDDKRLEIEAEGKKSMLVDILIPGKSVHSKVIVDREPFGSADFYIDRSITIKKGKEDIYDRVEDLSQASEEKINSVQKAYTKLLSHATSELN